MTREAAGMRRVPDRLVMRIDGLVEPDAQFLASQAVEIARTLAPKLSGDSARNFDPVWGDGFFGVRWGDDHVWYQEKGIRAFTMRSLAGKTIPMWIDDPTGAERRKYPRARTRTTESGKTQVLIFRRAAPIGSRKTVVRRGAGGELIRTTVPRSYPGAPGRIEYREARRPDTTRGRVGGQIMRRNVGVRWRHPGLFKRNFIRQGLVLAAQRSGVPVGPIRDNFGRFH